MLGNRCGHNPENPVRFSAPANHAAHPRIIQTVIDRFSKYFDSPSLCPALNSANASTRQQRSERRESCTLVMAAILHYTDLITLRVGIPNKNSTNGMSGITVEYIASICNIGERRTERAIRDLKTAGLITVHPRCEKTPNGDYIGLAAIRTVPARLFELLRLSPWLAHERRKAIARRNKKNVPQPKNAMWPTKAANSGQNNSGPVSIDAIFASMRSGLHPAPS